MDGVLFGERSKSSTFYKKKALSLEQPKSSFSYNLERVKSVSLPYSSNILTTENNLSDNRDDIKEERLEDHNGFITPFWDSLRSQSGLAHQYQGTEETC